MDNEGVVLLINNGQELKKINQYTTHIYFLDIIKGLE